MIRGKQIRQFAAAVGTAAVLLGAVVPAAWALTEGQMAPEFNLPSRDGTVQLSSLRGKLVYVDFWASWCGPCKQSFPWMNEMQAKYGPSGFAIVGVNIDGRREDADKFLSSTSAQFTIVFDSRKLTPDKYSVKGMPSSYLIGPDGKVLYVHSGFSEEQKSQLEARIRASLPKR